MAQQLVPHDDPLTPNRPRRLLAPLLQVLRALSASEGAVHAQRIRSLGAGGSRGGRPQFRRSHLVKPKDQWPAQVGSTGLTMELVRTDPATGAAHFRYAHTAAHRAAHDAYEECVQSHDPNTLVQLLQHYPYHAEALLALSELMGYSGEPQQARNITHHTHTLQGGQALSASPGPPPFRP